MILALTLLGVAIGSALYNQRPAHEDDLAIPIGELRSQGFELKLLNDHLGHGRDRRFVQAHARQLKQSIERARDELASMQPTAELAATRAAALERSARLAGAAAELEAARAPLAAATAAQIVAIAGQLKSLEEGLKR